MSRIRMPLAAACILLASGCECLFPGIFDPPRERTPSLIEFDPHLELGLDLDLERRRFAPRRLWFDDLPPHLPPLSDAALRQGLPVIADALRFGGHELTRLAAELQADTTPRIVLLSASAAGRTARVGLGSGRGFRDAIEHALARTVIRRLQVGARTELWLKLDVVTSAEPFSAIPDQDELPLIAGIDGLALAPELGVALLPEELAVHALLDADGFLDAESASRFYTARTRQRRALPPAFATTTQRLFRFATRSLFLDASPAPAAEDQGPGAGAREALLLERGHRGAVRLAPEVFLEAAQNAAGFLVRTARTTELASGESGAGFLLGYHPESGAREEEFRLVLHAETTAVLLTLVERTGERAILELAGRALATLRELVVELGPAGTRTSVVARRDRIELAEVAAAVFAFAEHARVAADERSRETARRLGRYLVASLGPHGEFVERRAFPDGRALPGRSASAPSLAVLALTALHRADPDPRGAWLAAATRAASRLAESRERIPTPYLPHDHYLIVAVAALPAVAAAGRLDAHAIQLAEAIVATQNASPEFADEEGSYATPPRCATVARRSFALAAAYAVAQRAGRQDAAARIRMALERSLRFQLRAQIRPERALYLAEPAMALGAFTRNLTDYEVRLEALCYNIATLLAYPDGEEDSLEQDES